MNYRITDFQCALGISQLKKLKKFVMIRNLLAKNYDKSFKNIDFMKCPTINSDVKHAFHLYPLQINFDKIKKNKNIFFRKLLQKNIKLQVHYIPLHQQPLFKKFVKSYSKNELRISEKFYQNEVSLPIYPSLGIKNQQKVISQILKNV